MKKFLAAYLVLLSVMAFPQESIRFENTSFKDILAKAKKENKIVFMDAFASWCGPCKLMEKNVFTEAGVRDYYNANFINARFDMEKGEGFKIAQQYGVRSYPTFLYLNGDGEVVYKGMGYVAAADFINMGKEANNPFNKKGSIKAQFEKGEKDPEFLKNALKVYANTDMDFAKRVSERYFQVKKYKAFSQEEISMLLYFLKSTDDANYQVFKNSKAEIVKILPENIYNQFDNQLKLSKVVEKALNIQAKTINDAYFLAEAGKLVGNDEAKASLNRLKLSFYPSVGNFAEYEKAAMAYFGTGEGFNPSELNAAAYIFSEKITNRTSLKAAQAWAEKSVMAGETVENTFTLAKLYSKTGNKPAAKMYAEQALKLAQQSKIDAAPINQLLETLR